MNGREEGTERTTYGSARLEIKRPVFQQLFESLRVRAAVLHDENMFLLVVMVQSRDFHQ